MKKIESMRQASAHVDRILLEKVPTWIQEGITEKQLFERLCEAILAQGKYGLSFDPIIAFGAGGAEPHHEATDVSLSIGDSILIDCGATYNGWCSDCTRMFSLGIPSELFQKKYKKLLVAHQSVLPHFQAGASCSALDRYVRDLLAEDAAFFIHTLGHGVGEEVHIAPRIGKDSQEVLQEGDVVTCEPGVYFSGEFGIRIEDQLFIQKGMGPEYITSCPRDLAIVDAWGNVTYAQ